MRVLLVAHRYPPRHTAGTEQYTAALARSLAARGVDVHVASAEKDVARGDLAWSEREQDGVPVHELTQNLLLDDFARTWDHPEVDARFAELLARLEPDVVHAQHLLYLSVGVLEEARRRGAAVLFTLHDYWLECPRMGQLVHADGSLCATVDFARCGTCLPSFAWRQPPLAAGVARLLAGVRSATRVDLAPLVARAARRARPGPPFRPPPAAESVRFEGYARARSEGLRARVVAAVDRFFAPSRFLRDRLVAWGLPAERVEHLPTGVDPLPATARAPRAPGAPLRVLFLGSFVPLKGAHVLVEAWRRIPPEARAGARLALFGPGGHAPAYRADLARAARAAGADLGPALDRAGVARELARADVLVVPSLWFENRPLVILEALAARVALLVSDLGGAAELVREGVNGWLFPAGDSGALARRLESLAARPELLAGLAFARGPELPSWEDVADRTLAAYGEARGARGGREDAP